MCSKYPIAFAEAWSTKLWQMSSLFRRAISRRLPNNHCIVFRRDCWFKLRHPSVHNLEQSIIKSPNRDVWRCHITILKWRREGCMEVTYHNTEVEERGEKKRSANLQPAETQVTIYLVRDEVDRILMMEPSSTMNHYTN